ncbi:MAG: hypothetical protein IPM84_12745 [Anaerolineae bacterium]|nr:hypothetical protein [Anaerolineae bacterium]
MAGRLVKAADWVAPLVGRDIISYDPAHDRRQRLASLLVAISVLFAALQFVVEFFNFFTRLPGAAVSRLALPVAPLAIAAGLLMFLAARLSLRRPCAAVAAIGLAVITTLGLAYGAWTLVDRLQPPSRFIIAMPFDGAAIEPPD